MRRRKQERQNSISSVVKRLSKNAITMVVERIASRQMDVHSHTFRLLGICGVSYQFSEKVAIYENAHLSTCYFETFIFQEIFDILFFQNFDNLKEFISSALKGWLYLKRMSKYTPSWNVWPWPSSAFDTSLPFLLCFDRNLGLISNSVSMLLCLLVVFFFFAPARFSFGKIYFEY